MSVKCLMLETSDKRRLFTPLGGRKSLEACCKAFGTKMQVVRADLKRSQLLAIDKLVVALCDAGRGAKKIDYEPIKQSTNRRSSPTPSRSKQFGRSQNSR